MAVSLAEWKEGTSHDATRTITMLLSRAESDESPGEVMLWHLLEDLEVARLARSTFFWLFQNKCHLRSVQGFSLKKRNPTRASLACSAPPNHGVSEPAQLIYPGRSIVV